MKLSKMVGVGTLPFFYMHNLKFKTRVNECQEQEG